MTQETSIFEMMGDILHDEIWNSGKIFFGSEHVEKTHQNTMSGKLMINQ